MAGPTRILAIETASEACSIALFEGGKCLAHDHRVLGRGHAEALIPMIAGLPDRGKAQRICVSRGPGSFTGVRIGIAAARALGLAWGAEVLGYPTLALVAAMARIDHPGEAVTVAMTGGHGEWFVQHFDHDGLPEEALSIRASAPAARGQLGEHRNSDHAGDNKSGLYDAEGNSVVAGRGWSCHPVQHHNIDPSV